MDPRHDDASKIPLRDRKGGIPRKSDEVCYYWKLYRFCPNTDEDCPFQHPRVEPSPPVSAYINLLPGEESDDQRDNGALERSFPLTETTDKSFANFSTRRIFSFEPVKGIPNELNPLLHLDNPADFNRSLSRLEASVLGYPHNNSNDLSFSGTDDSAQGQDCITLEDSPPPSPPAPAFEDDDEVILLSSSGEDDDGEKGSTREADSQEQPPVRTRVTRMPSGESQMTGQSQDSQLQDIPLREVLPLRAPNAMELYFRSGEFNQADWKALLPAERAVWKKKAELEKQQHKKRVEAEEQAQRAMNKAERRPSNLPH